MLVLYTLHKCPLKIVHKLNSTPLLLKLRALIRGSRTGHVTRPKGARLPYCLAALSRARDNASLSELLSPRAYALLKAPYSRPSKYYAFVRTYVTDLSQALPSSRVYLFGSPELGKPPCGQNLALYVCPYHYSTPCALPSLCFRSASSLLSVCFRSAFGNTIFQRRST